MKRVIGLVIAFGAASCIASGATTTKVTPPDTAPKAAARQEAMLQLAPADEYFGPLKMSILGIRNTIRDLGLRYDVNHDIALETYASALLTERAIRDWESKYPRDSQLPRAVYYLQRLYTKILTQRSRDQAKLTASWLFVDFAVSAQAKQLHKVLVVEHLAALPTPKPVATPTPTYQSVFGPSYPSLFGSGAGGGTNGPGSANPTVPGPMSSRAPQASPQPS